MRDKPVAVGISKADDEEAKDPDQCATKKLREQALATFIVTIADKPEHKESTHWKAMQGIRRQAADEREGQGNRRRRSFARPAKGAGRSRQEMGHGRQVRHQQDRSKSIDDSTRSNFMPYGISGVMLGAALVFFAFIGFDSISTHSEEAIKPQRDVPFGILASLGVCTVLYIAVSAVITGMVPYPDIDTTAAVASAFTDRRREDGRAAVLQRCRRPDRRRRLGRHDQRAADHVPQPGPHLPGDGPRRPAAAQHLRRRAPEVQDAARLDDADRHR